MKEVVLQALTATVCTWLVTACGAAVVIFFKHTNEKAMNLMLGFAAGVMIAASFWSLLQPAVEQAEKYLSTPPWIVITAGFTTGALFMWASDKAVNYTRKKVNNAGADASERFNRIILLILSITLHNIPEGLAVGVAFGVMYTEGGSAEALMGAITIAMGIGLQNFPEGAAVALPLRREGCSRKKSFLIGQASGMVEPVAGVLGAAAVVKMQHILPYTLSFAAGAMILVAVHELIPECQRNQKAQPYLATAGIVSGFVLMMLLDVALG